MTAPIDAVSGLGELRALANKATSGKWYIYTGEDGEPISLAADGVGPNGGWVGKTVAQFGVPYRTRTAEQIAADAAYLKAVQPAAVLALLDAIEAQARELAEARERTKQAVKETRAFWDALVSKGARFRDCADFDGRCQGDGHPCDPQAHALENLAKLKTRIADLEDAVRVKDDILRDLVATLHVRGKMMTVCHDDLWALEKRARTALAKGQNALVSGREDGYVTADDVERRQLATEPEECAEPGEEDDGSLDPTEEVLKGRRP